MNMSRTEAQLIIAILLQNTSCTRVLCLLEHESFLQIAIHTALVDIHLGVTTLVSGLEPS